MPITLRHIIFGGSALDPKEARMHRAYLALSAALLAFGNTLISLCLSAASSSTLSENVVFSSYFLHPLVVLLNFFPAALLFVFGWCLTRRAWAGYLLSAVPTVGFALVNHYKIQLRGDPLLISDLRLIRTAGGIVGHYSIVWTNAAALAVILPFLLLAGTIYLMRDELPNGRARLVGLLVCSALAPLLFFGIYMDDVCYAATANPESGANDWSDLESYVSRGFWYPFLHSAAAVSTVPEGYVSQAAEREFILYPDLPIPEDRRVHVMGIMLEAFADLSDFPVLADIPQVRSLYAPLHKLEEESVSGDLLTNIFAGGTVDTEWGFLTGYSRHGEFRTDVESYVRYFNEQGYDTMYRHPGYSWFYNRQNINGYLGFQESVFSENGFGELVHPMDATWRSDWVLFDYLLADLDARDEDSPPMFSFSVSYQNHGPYSDVPLNYSWNSIPASEFPWSETSRSILNCYFDGLVDTILELVHLTEELEAREQPVPLVVLGDHKPWLGNDASVYQELGINLDLRTPDGFYNFYAAPYLIWANSAAKETLGMDFVGNGGVFSPCLLMTELFDCCGWDGPGFLRLSREMRAYTPLLHERGLFLENGVLTDRLSPEADEFWHRYLRIQYWRETRGLSYSDR